MRRRGPPALPGGTRPSAARGWGRACAAAAPLAARRSRSLSAGGASFVAGGPGRAPPPSRVGRRRSGGAILRCCGRRVGRLWREGGGGGGRDSINRGNHSGSGGGCGRCSGLASPFARPRGQDFADMSDVEENNFEGRVSGRPCRGRAEGRPGASGAARAEAAARLCLKWLLGEPGSWRGLGASRPPSPCRPRFFLLFFLWRPGADQRAEALPGTDWAPPPRPSPASFSLHGSVPSPWPGLRALPPRSSLRPRPGLAEPRALSPLLPYFRPCPSSRAVRPPIAPRAALAVPARSLCERRRSRPAAAPSDRAGEPREARPASGAARAPRPRSRGLYLSAPLRFCNRVRPMSSLPLPPSYCCGFSVRL